MQRLAGVSGDLPGAERDRHRGPVGLGQPRQGGGDVLEVLDGQDLVGDHHGGLPAGLDRGQHRQDRVRRLLEPTSPWSCRAIGRWAVMSAAICSATRAWAPVNG